MATHLVFRGNIWPYLFRPSLLIDHWTRPNDSPPSQHSFAFNAIAFIGVAGRSTYLLVQLPPPPRGVNMSGAISFVEKARPNQHRLFFSLVQLTATILNCTVQPKILSSFMTPRHYWCTWSSACPIRFTGHILLSTPGYKVGDCVPVMSLFTLPPPSRMDSPQFLGNFASPAPLDKEALGPPKQIAYYSCFSGPTNEYEYQSREALKLYWPQTVPFSFIQAPDKSTWAEGANYADSLPPSGIEPIITSCERAGCIADLNEADVITKRGVLVKYDYPSALSDLS